VLKGVGEQRFWCIVAAKTLKSCTSFSDQWQTFVKLNSSEQPFIEKWNCAVQRYIKWNSRNGRRME
jgi:hypothetical protein